MAGLARTIELQRAEAPAVMSFKTRLIDYLQRFIGDLVTRSSQIAELLIDLRPFEQALLQIAAERDASNAAPSDVGMDTETLDSRLTAWNERWAGLTRWFVSNGRDRAKLTCCAPVRYRQFLACCKQSRCCTNGARAAAIAPRIFVAWRCGLPRRAATATLIGYGGPPSGYRRRGIWRWRSPMLKSVPIPLGATRPVSRSYRSFANKGCYRRAARRPASRTVQLSAACSQPASQRKPLKPKWRANAWPPIVILGCPSWGDSMRRRFDCFSAYLARLSLARRILTGP